MWTGIEFLIFLQGVRDSLPDFVTEFFLLVSRHEFIGAIPIVIAAFFLWSVGKREGEFLLFNISFVGVIGGIIKSTVNQPRPWVLDPDVHPVPEAQATARGGSLPSSHSTAALASYGSAAWVSEVKALRVLFLLVAIIIPFSRLFLGVHTPLDIIAALAIVLAIAFVNYKVLSWSHESERNRLYALVGYIIAAVVIGIISDVRSGTLLSSGGALMCLAIPIFLMIEERFVGYEPPEDLRDRIVIAIPGLVIMIVSSLSVNSFRFAIPGIGNVLLMFFLILVYPYILKKYLAYRGRGT